ncbi:transglutaminase family protein [Phototrophicus methaneseepsis]|uniref:Transglutaminase family protein n=1 Tax=Phototrophicus methaneseepsis TaxID=2710758 RepID=A0A7S8EBW9_9CHLR|nr:transglutaminase family protein [Phototrophicus methaneseepsis]QPC84142.1 transglutaminase family protein [Phototrophicus methaneseepsis]
MYYAVSHLTIYKYSAPVTDSVMELRVQPRTDDIQRCVRFNLDVRPKATSSMHRDYLGNIIHNFDVPSAHERLALKAESVVEIGIVPEVPDSMDESAWEALDAATASDRDLYDMLLPGQFTKSTALLEQFAKEIDWRRRGDPLSLVRELTAAIYNAFDYESHVTRVDSPIDVALAARGGVCQDFTHIMLTLTRQLGIPSRYVSGYLFHRDDRSDEDASHAWVECWLPGLGWIGLDPTNNLIVGDRHIRVTVAQDYATAAPSKGVFKGGAETELEVRVMVAKLDTVPVEESTLAPDMILPQFGYATESQQQQQQ